LLPLGFGLIGLDSIIDAMLPISCAPSLDARCTLMGTHSLVTEAHLIESTVVGVVTFIAPLMWWQWHRRRHQILAHASLWFVGLQAFVGAAILLTREADMNIVGALQRGYQLGIGLWMALIVLAAYQSPKTSAQPEPATTEAETALPI
jgi:hypothetical protein